MRNKIKEVIIDSINIRNIMLNDEISLSNINNICDTIITCYKNKGKVLFCGNGGSAADAQHLAAELSGRFNIDRKPLFAESLNVNTSYITSVSNDYGYEHIYDRLVEAFGKKGDILICLTTSGKSKNIIKCLKTAINKGMNTITLTGLNNVENSDHIINIQSTNTARIQECHMMIGHIICEIVEKELFKNGYI